MSIVSQNGGTQNLPNPPLFTPPVSYVPHQIKLNNLISDFSSVYSDPSLKYSAKKEILEAQVDYLESFMYALIKTLPNTDRVESVEK